MTTAFLMTRRLCLGLLAFLVAFMAGEAILRLWFPSVGSGYILYRYLESERGKFCEYDPVLGWSGVANARASFEWADARCWVNQNTFGFRGPAHGYARTGKKRVLVLGDSFVWGFGVNEDEVLTHHLESEIRPPIEVLNLGVSGYGTDQELLVWKEKGARWKPDHVLLFVTFVTDLYDNAAPERYGYPKPMFTRDSAGALVLSNVPVPRRTKWRDDAGETGIGQAPLVRRMLYQSRFLSLLVEVLSTHPSGQRVLDRFHILPRPQGGYEWEYPLYQVPYDTFHKVAWQRLSTLLSLLRADIHGQGAKLTLVLVPSVIQVYPDLWDKFVANAPARYNGRVFDKNAPNREFHRMAQSLDIPVVDLLPRLTILAKTSDRLYFPINRHWTAEGHRAVARIILNELRLS